MRKVNIASSCVAKFEDAVYVLHVFAKKTWEGILT